MLNFIKYTLSDPLIAAKSATFHALPALSLSFCNLYHTVSGFYNYEMPSAQLSHSAKGTTWLLYRCLVLPISSHQTCLLVPYLFRSSFSQGAFWGSYWIIYGFGTILRGFWEASLLLNPNSLSLHLPVPCPSSSHSALLSLHTCEIAAIKLTVVAPHKLRGQAHLVYPDSAKIFAKPLRNFPLSSTLLSNSISPIC